MKRFLKVIVWLVMLVALGVGGTFWYVKTHEDVVLTKIFDFADKNVDKIDIDDTTRTEVHTFITMARQIFVVDDVTRRYLVLLQNNMELRPGGGFLGQYATVEILNGRIVAWDIEDANHLDHEIHSDIPAPPSLLRWLDIKNLEFRDSNWELDFPTNAAAAMHLYNLGPQQQDFDGVIAINASMLNDFLAITGPITVPGYEDKGAFTADNALIHLEDIVEKPVLLYKMKQECKKREKETGIEEICNSDPETGEKIPNLTEADKVYRKAVLPHLARAIAAALVGSGEQSLQERYDIVQAHLPTLLTLVVHSLDHRDVQLWFADNTLQDTVVAKNWGTIVDTQWDGDYVAVVDANLGALKSDYYIKRRLEYTVDFTGKSAEQNDAAAGRMVRYLTEGVKDDVMARTFRTTRPLATMRMIYEHTAQKANYRTSDYHAYTRLYTPAGTKWYVREWFFNPTVETDVYGNKQAFAYKFDIFIGDTLPTMLQYTLPETIREDDYALKIQKQSGIGVLPVTMTLITKDGTKYETSFDLTRDAIVRLVGTGSDRVLNVEYL